MFVPESDLLLGLLNGSLVGTRRKSGENTERKEKAEYN